MKDNKSKLPFTIEEVKTALPKIEKGLEKYLRIMGKIRKVNVAQDQKFQTLFNGLFMVRRNEAFRIEYYRFMEEYKCDKDLTPKKVLDYLFEKTGRVEMSFSSKLLSVINSKMPVLDSCVLKNLGRKKPLLSLPKEKQIKETVELHDEICQWYKEFLKTEQASQWIEMFDELYPQAKKISKIKKIDLILWKIRIKE